MLVCAVIVLVDLLCCSCCYFLGWVGFVNSVVHFHFRFVVLFYFIWLWCLVFVVRCCALLGFVAFCLLFLVVCLVSGLVWRWRFVDFYISVPVCCSVSVVASLFVSLRGLVAVRLVACLLLWCFSVWCWS